MVNIFLPFWFFHTSCTTHTSWFYLSHTFKAFCSKFCNKNNSVSNDFKKVSEPSKRVNYLLWCIIQSKLFQNGNCTIKLPISISKTENLLACTARMYIFEPFFMQASNFKDKQTTKENRWSSLGSLTCSGRFAPHKMRVHVMRTTRHFWDNKRPHTTKNIALIFFLHQASALLLFSTCT